MNTCPICGNPCRIDSKGRERATCGNSSCRGEILRRVAKTPERCEKLSRAMKGRVVSEESRLRMSKAKKGTHHSEETKRKMSEAKRGKKVSAETRHRMSIAAKRAIAEGRGHFPGHVSRGERELVDYIRSIYGGDIILNGRKLLGGFELDVYLPELKLAFEYNGEYWHTLPNIPERDAFKRRECRKRKIALLNVWEKDWKERPDYIKGFISALINNKPLDRFVHP